MSLRITGRRTALVLAAAIVLLLLSATIVVANHQFTDVPSGIYYHNAVDWIKDRGITGGCNQAGTKYCPDNFVKRGDMAIFLQKTAASVAAAGFHVDRDGTNIVIDSWFNNVNGAAPVLSGSAGSYSVDMNFNASTRYAVCTIDGNFVDTRNANCVAGVRWFSPGSESVDIYLWDPELGFHAAEFNILIY